MIATTRTLLSDDVLADAMRTVYADGYASYCERIGIDYNFSGCELTTTINYRDGVDAELLPIGWEWIGRIEMAWGHSVDAVFEAMGFDEGEDLGKHLWHVLAPCLGHGVSLLDDHSEAFEAAMVALGVKANRRNHAPVYLDGDNRVAELAENDLDAEINAGDVGLRLDSREILTVGDEVTTAEGIGKFTRFLPWTHESDRGFVVITHENASEEKIPLDEID